MMLSIVIPARFEKYLQQTIYSILGAATGEIEIIAVLDGYWPDPPIEDKPNVHLIHFPEPRGMRAAINAGAKLAKGEYLMKCDAHCMFAHAFDEVLKADCEDDWTLVPVRYSLDSNKWTKKEDKKYEFEYISSDDLKGKRWPEYAKRVEGETICDLMTSQGSCWFMRWQRFWDLGGEDEENYGTMGREAQEICLKSWLSGGRYALDRNTWYAHWSKSKSDPRFSHRDEKQKSVKFAKDLWMNDKWPLATRTLQWLVDKFAPVPTWENKPKEIVKLDDAKNLKTLLQKQKRFRRGTMSPIKVRGYKRNPHLYRLFNELGFKNGVEVGVKDGANALAMCKQIAGISLGLVEPWDISCSKYKIAIKNLEPYNVKPVCELSMNALSEFKDNSLDFVYIDANHRFDYVMEDIIHWSKKVRPGGIVSGHDYWNWKKGEVVLAVNAYIKAHNIQDFFVTDEEIPSWFWVKK